MAIERQKVTIPYGAGSLEADILRRALFAGEFEELPGTKTLGVLRRV